MLGPPRGGVVGFFAECLREVVVVLSRAAPEASNSVLNATALRMVSENMPDVMFANFKWL